MKNVNKVSATELANVLRPITKSTTISITYLVDDSRSKTKNKQKQVQKLVTINNVYLNHNYAKKVQNLTGEDFVAKSLEDYGKFRVSTTLIGSLKTGEMMLDGKVLNSESISEIKYFHNGIEITEEEGEKMDLWTPAYYKPKTKTTMGRGTVSEEDDFNIINTYLTRIKKMKLQGEVYEVV